ncbi:MULTISPECIES: hypothetical protein [Bacillus cereus group]|uniref:hypothetical protein n=1 Tax=Bacillus cereus group TaxID=86661 RepID=UPI0018F3B943|nr:hypothetical protein [Bacillus cereus group sp. N24]MBJ7950101.1 hypothetical protein [Bacillus cereus group sp. N24]
MKEQNLNQEQEKVVTEQYELVCEKTWNCLSPKNQSNMATFRYFPQNGEFAWEKCGCDKY